MVGSAIVAGNGVVLIEIPDGGLTGEVLTKISNDDFDFDWQPGGGGGGGDVLTLSVPLGIFTLTQSSGVSPLTVDLNPLLATVDLQSAYDADPTIPQILINGVPNPLTIDASVVGDIFTLRGTIGTILMNMATAGSEIWGGHNSGNLLTLAGANAGADVGRVNIDSPTEFFYAEGNTTPAEQSCVRWRPTFSTSGAYIGGWFANNATITYTNAFYIYSSIQDNSVHISNAPAGFQAWTLFNALCSIQRGTNNALVQAIVLNDGVNHRNATAAAAVTSQHITVSSVGNVIQALAGGSMTVTNGILGLQFAPKYNCIAGGAVDLSDLIAVDYIEVGVALFGNNAGTRTVDNMIGLDMPNITGAIGYTRTGEIAAVRSAQNVATDAFFLRHTGTAISTIGGNMQFTRDLIGPVLGLSQDWTLAWAAGGFMLEQQNTGAVEQWRKSFPAAGRMLFDWSNDMELNINTVLGCSIGDQTGALGNSFFNIVQGAVTPASAGDFAGVLLTQSGNYTNNGLARGRVSAWVINPLSYAASTGSVGEADTLTVAGFPTSSPGVTLTTRQSLNVIGGRTRLSSIIQTPPINPAALTAGNNNDYAGLLTGTANNGMRGWARLTPNGAGSTLTGIDATVVQDGDTVVLTNLGAATITITNQDAASAAANRIDLGSWSGTLTADDSCTLKYDATSTFWRVVGSNIA